MTYHLLSVEKLESVTIVTMNNPARRNALSEQMMRELIAALDQVSADRALRAVILAATGSVFSSGHDLREMVGAAIDAQRRLFDCCAELMSKVQSIPQPVIAEVQGLATAAGCQLAASCDLAIAGESASFATPGVKIGLFCTTPMVALTRAIGRKRAMELLLTGRVIDAPTAAQWGLVNRVVPDRKLREATLALANAVAESSSFTVSLGKQAFYAQIDLDQPKAYAYAKEVMSLNAMANDAQEGMGAFLEKRAPCWVGR